jgi:uncharacterized protein YbjT (DUF2867 family)
MAVLVTGARGKTGREVVAQLGREPEVVVRAGSSGTELPAAERIRPVRFDWRDPATWDPAVSGVDAVYLMRPDVPDAPELVGRLVDLAPRAHVVLLSEQGAGRLPAEDWVRRVEDTVVRGADTWTLLRPSWFQQNLSDPRFLRDAIRAEGVLSLSSGGAGIAWVDARDIAAVAVAALLRPADHHGRAYDVTGPEAVTIEGVAEELSRQLGRRVRAVDPPVGESLGGADPWLRGVLEGIYGRVRRGEVGEVAPTVEDVTGRPPGSIAEFVRSHLPVWRT